MYLSSLRLSQFKNYREANISFSAEINCFVGKNGSGKTNVLDAIYYLSFTKSFFNSVDHQQIKHDEGFFTIEGNFVNGKLQENVRVVVKRGDKKSVKRNNNEHKKFSDHIGLYPLVMITPD